MTKPLTASERRKLQGMINRTAKTGRAYYEQQAALNDWARERYGVEPGDIDADVIIDAVFGGSGNPCGMDADEFDDIMRAG